MPGDDKPQFSEEIMGQVSQEQAPLIKQYRAIQKFGKEISQRWDNLQPRGEQMIGVNNAQNREKLQNLMNAITDVNEYVTGEDMGFVHHLIHDLDGGESVAYPDAKRLKKLQDTTHRWKTDIRAFLNSYSQEKSVEAAKLQKKPVPIKRPAPPAAKPVPPVNSPEEPAAKPAASDVWRMVEGSSTLDEFNEAIKILIANPQFSSLNKMVINNAARNRPKTLEIIKSWIEDPEKKAERKKNQQKVKEYQIIMAVAKRLISGGKAAAKAPAGMARTEVGAPAEKPGPDVVAKAIAHKRADEKEAEAKQPEYASMDEYFGSNPYTRKDEIRKYLAKRKSTARGIPVKHWAGHEKLRPMYFRLFDPRGHGLTGSITSANGPMGLFKNFRSKLGKAINANNLYSGAYDLPGKTQKKHLNDREFLETVGATLGMSEDDMKDRKNSHLLEKIIEHPNFAKRTSNTGGAGRVKYGYKKPFTDLQYVGALRKYLFHEKDDYSGTRWYREQRRQRKKQRRSSPSPSPGIPGGRVPAPKPRPKRSEHSDVVHMAPKPKPGDTQSNTKYVPTRYTFPQNQAHYTHLLQLGEGLTAYMKSNPSKNLGWTTDDGTVKHSHVQYKRMVYWTNVAHEQARVRQAGASYPDNPEGGRKMWENAVPHFDEARRAAGFRIKDQSKDAGDWADKLKNLHAASNAFIVDKFPRHKHVVEDTRLGYAHWANTIEADIDAYATALGLSNPDVEELASNARQHRGRVPNLMTSSERNAHKLVAYAGKDKGQFGPDDYSGMMHVPELIAARKELKALYNAQKKQRKIKREQDPERARRREEERKIAQRKMEEVRQMRVLMGVDVSPQAVPEAVQPEPAPPPVLEMDPEDEKDEPEQPVAVPVPPQAVLQAIEDGVPLDAGGGCGPERGRRPSLFHDRRRLKARQGILAGMAELGTNNGYAHWLHSAPGRPGPMGRVHLISADRRIHQDSMQNHFLTEMEADANMGMKQLFSNRRGPFKRSRGPSRIASRTKHVVFRERGTSTEITIRRNASVREIQAMVNKIRAYNAYSRILVFLVIGTKSHKLGYLSTLDMDKLYSRIAEEVNSKTIGIRLQHEGGATANSRHVH